MNEAKPNFTFLIEYVLKLLEENNVYLDEEQQKMYVPQILAQVELRLGLELLPKLNEAQRDEYLKMLADTNTKPEQWDSFWHTAVPTFEEDVKNILISFAEKAKQIMK